MKSLVKILAMILTVVLAVWEIRSKGVITGLTLAPGVLILIVSVSKEIYRDMKYHWDLLCEEENNG